MYECMFVSTGLSLHVVIPVLLTLGRHLVTRWQHCVDVVSQWMGAAVGALYVRKYVHSNTVSQVGGVLVYSMFP